ncbi:MAG: pyridoxal-phosphate dependent enzyme, partial [Burkholderiaceae bacterium]|nr:pyridoxal-phosphate dependent enzyme [Burkholderiaceae bacterium]
MLQKLRQLTGLIGNTPLLQIDCTYRGQPRRVYAKAEHYNLTGSIKDRMALHILWRAIEQGRLQPGAPIAEATSGNTGIAFSALGAFLGCPVVIFMPDWMSRERISLIESFGARVHLVSRAEGGFLGSIQKSEQFAAQTPGAFLPCQFSNHDNSQAHYLTTGPELWAQLQTCGVRPDAFVAGVGTGGTVMGVGRYLR